ncbi:MAG: hypothetical protein AAF990_09160 [Bacteroidota bacterium]
MRKIFNDYPYYLDVLDGLEKLYDIYGDQTLEKIGEFEIYIDQQKSKYEKVKDVFQALFCSASDDDLADGSQRLLDFETRKDEESAFITNADEEIEGSKLVELKWRLFSMIVDEIEQSIDKKVNAIRYLDFKSKIIDTYLPLLYPVKKDISGVMEDDTITKIENAKHNSLKGQRAIRRPNKPFWGTTSY